MPLRVRSCGLARIHLLIRRRVRFDVCVFAQRRGGLGVLLFSGMRVPSMRQRGVAVLRRFVCRLFAGVFVRVRVFVAKLIGRVPSWSVGTLSSAGVPGVQSSALVASASSANAVPVYTDASASLLSTASSAPAAP